MAFLHLFPGGEKQSACALCVGDSKASPLPGRASPNRHFAAAARQDLLQRIGETSQQTATIVFVLSRIYGGRQLGKTALLRRAERTFVNPAADHYAVWIDLLAQGIGERRPAADVWLSVSDKLKELQIPGLILPSINPSRPSTIDGFLAAIKGYLVEKPGRRILLLLDEADHFFEQDARHAGAYAETRRLKQLMDETDRRFKVVFPSGGTLACPQPQFRANLFYVGALSRCIPVLPTSTGMQM